MVGWMPFRYLFGEGLRVATAGRSWELVPYVVGPGGVIAGFAIVRDGSRNGFTRVEGPIETAIAVAVAEIESELTTEE